MHGDSRSCKSYKPLPKQEHINRLSGKHPRTPLTQISSVATHRSDANGARLFFHCLLDGMHIKITERSDLGLFY